MNFIKLYIRFIVVFLKSKMEYRFSFFMDLFTNVFTYSLLFVSIWVILNKFQHIQGWGFYEVMFLYNLNLFTYAISGMFIKHPMLDLEKMVQNGDFDSVLIKPIDPLYHIVVRQFEYTFFGHILLSIVVFCISVPKIGIPLNSFNILWFALFIIGGVLIHSSIMIISGSMSFWFVKSTSILEMGIYDIRSFLNYPISIYQNSIQIFLTFVLPFAFVNFYPAQFFLQKEGNDLFHPLLQFGTPIVGIITIFIAYYIWSVGVNNYQSTGS
ncbi:ABC transporter permease [Gracilibacillus halophilus YIM-C55.5]|uniref:ABC transporter permease n=1 Tax=Gracilibacillus halophilus YIM-C55.5 TaxID=1308866 RepID=N4WQZ5_9BACI|nr:ABC-2 family transporter protein [Gracilibacillus halophilus]ENH95631.1 ABC transporter permease [Gracilibacillus halophilus YIM-C55.5]